MVFPEMLDRSLTGNGLDAPHTGRDATFLQNLDKADLAGRGSMGPAAKLGRKISDLNHAYPVTVLFPEQRHRMILVDRNIDRHILDDFHFPVPQHLFIDDVLNILQLLVLHSREV